MMFNTNYNPDVLSCLANLSNDEVFTPPNLVNQMLDTLPQELFQSKKTTFLDPVTKSGVFLREIAKRLNKGLENEISDRQERLNHIFTKQLFGIAITELTALLARRSLYCTKKANSDYSICNDFETEEGNIKFDRTLHTWKNGKCTFCGANEDAYKRGDQLETHAYEFIHTDEPEKIYNMKFDVIIGNPPYQLETGGTKRQAVPIYNKFVQQAKKLNPRFLSMIIPARWYSGGMGLSKFREEMMNDTQIKELVDFESSSDVFPAVEIAGGICYFLWERGYDGDCLFSNFIEGNKQSVERKLNEFEIFIRQSRAIPILKKIFNSNSNFLSNKVSSTKPFGISTNYEANYKGIPCVFKKSIGNAFVNVKDVDDRNNIINRWKVIVPEAPIAGQTDFSKPIKFYHNNNTIIVPPGTICSESWIVLSTFSSEKEAHFFISYLFTKTVRFLVLQTVISQHVNRKNFKFVPDIMVWDKVFSDDVLRKMWCINDDEWEYIDSRIALSEI